MKNAKKLFSIVSGIAVASAVLFSPMASADQISGWSLNLPGGPTDTGINNLSFNGASYIVNTVVGNNISFAETGVFNIGQFNKGINLGLGGGQLTGNLTNVTGSGTLGGGITFNGGGTLDLYYSPTATYGTNTNRYGATAGIKIASFTELAGGGGAVNPDGTPNSNGSFTLDFQSTYLAPGVWFDANNNPLPAGFTLGFVTTNASEDISNSCPGPSCAPDTNLLSSFGAGPNDTPFDFLVVNGGQFKLQAVPEPGSVALLGLAMLGVVAMRRRNA